MFVERHPQNHCRLDVSKFCRQTGSRTSSGIFQGWITGRQKSRLCLKTPLTDSLVFEGTSVRRGWECEYARCKDLSSVHPSAFCLSSYKLHNHTTRLVASSIERLMSKAHLSSTPLTRRYSTIGMWWSVLFGYQVRARCFFTSFLPLLLSPLYLPSRDCAAAAALDTLLSLWYCFQYRLSSHCSSPVLCVVRRRDIEDVEISSTGG